MRMTLRIIGACVVAAGLYLSFWPVPIEPAAWTPSEDPGFSGPYAANERLKSPELLGLAGYVGPEDLAIGEWGWVLASVHKPGEAGGAILRFGPDGQAHLLAKTSGRPLGLDATPGGEVYVALADKGLGRIGLQGEEIVLSRVDGDRIRYPNDVALGPGGLVYLSDSTTRFEPEDFGGTLGASIVDIAEHRRTGRVIAYDPADGSARVISEGYAFANGIALSADGRWLAVVETSDYRIWRLWLKGPRAGEREILIEGLPGYPDNIEPDGRGGFWFGLVSPRRAIVDTLAGWPALRSAIFRLPASWRPGPARYGAIVRIDGEGRVIETLQDPSGRYASTTGAIRTSRHLYVSSLTAPFLARLPVGQRKFAEVEETRR